MLKMILFTANWRALIAKTIVKTKTTGLNMSTLKGSFKKLV